MPLWFLSCFFLLSPGSLEIFLEIFFLAHSEKKLRKTPLGEFYMFLFGSNTEQVIMFQSPKVPKELIRRPGVSGRSGPISTVTLKWWVQPVMKNDISNERKRGTSTTISASLDSFLKKTWRVFCGDEMQHKIKGYRRRRCIRECIRLERYGGHLRPYLSVTCDPTPLKPETRSLATLPLFTAPTTQNYTWSLATLPTTTRENTTRSLATLPTQIGRVTSDH